MKPSILTGVVIIALGALLFFLLHPKRTPWKHPHHVALQNAKCNVDDLTKALTNPSNPIPPDQYNLMVDGQPWPPPGSVHPPPGTGPASCDIDSTSSRPVVNVTQQVSFKTSKSMETFLTDANLSP